MPVVEIPEKDMVVEFPESMSPEEIERSIYADIYKQPVISQTPEPSFWEKTTGLLRGKQPTIGRRITEEDRRAFEPDVKIPRAPAKTPFQEVKEQIIADAKESLKPQKEPKTTVEDIFAKFVTEEQKEPEGITHYKGAPVFTPEKEMEYARKYPNLMAARYALASLLPFGELAASPTEEAEFHALPEKEKALRLTGELAAWSIMPPAIGWLTRAGGKLLAKKFPWMAKPILKALKQSNWFRRLTNKERGLVVQNIDEMKRAGWSDAEILKGLKSKPEEYTQFYRQLMKERGAGRAEKPPEPPKPVMPEGAVKPVEEIAAKKPIKKELETPTATFYGWQETGIPGKPPVAQYNIEGGEYDKSTVSAPRLKELGIEIPETPEPPKPLEAQKTTPEPPTAPTVEAKPKGKGEVATLEKEAIRERANKLISKRTGAKTPQELLNYYQKKYPALKGVRIKGLKATPESGPLSKSGVVKVSLKDGKLEPKRTYIGLTKDADLVNARHEIEHLLDVIHGKNLEGKQVFSRYEHEDFVADYLRKKQPPTPKAKGKEAWELSKGEIETRYPKAKETVDGRTVRTHIPNQSSIEASINTPTVLDGVREVSMSEFDAPPVINAKTKALAEEIKKSGEINPLIVAIDQEGAYILEGANRYDALKILKAKSIPAKVVLDEDSLYEAVKQAQARGETIPPHVLAEYPELKPPEKPATIKPVPGKKGKADIPTVKPPKAEGGLTREQAKKHYDVERDYVIDEIYDKGHTVNKDGTMTLYHATTKEKAPQIIKDKYLKRPPDAPDRYGVYFSTSPDVAENYGDGTLIKARIKVRDLNLEDVFPSGRLDFQVNTRTGIYKPAKIEPLPKPSRPPLEGGQKKAPAKVAKQKKTLADKKSSFSQTPGVYADTGGYATLKHSVIQMPEMVELAKQLLSGKYPSIKRKLRKRMAAGLFRASGLGKIELKAETFKDEDQAAAVLAHEIGHLVDWLPDRTLKRGNILGRIASLKRYMKHTLPKTPRGLPALTDKDRQRLRQIAKKLVKREAAGKLIDEEIRKELPITPDDVLAIWNHAEQSKWINPGLYEYVAKLNTPEKKSVVKEALKGQVPADLKQFAKTITEKTGRKIPVIPTKKMVEEKYRELLNAELKKREMFHEGEVMNELKNLSRMWKPFDPTADAKYTKYRYSSPELYADTFSALLNAPGLVRVQAPLFYEGFFNYMEKKPEVKDLYEQIQADIKGGEVEKKRMDGLYEMFRKGDDAYGLSLQSDIKFRDLLGRDFVDVNWFILKQIKQIGERNIPAGENPRYKLEDMAYSGSESEMYLTDVLRNTIKPLEKQGFDWDDFGIELFLRRVATERAEMANPRGWTPKLAQKKLDELKELRMPEQNQAMQEAIDAFHRIHQYVIDKADKANRWGKDFIEQMRETTDYATFDVIKYIEKRHGIAPSGQIYQQVGTFNEVSNPATATILKDIAIMKATNRGIAAESVTDFLKKHFPNEIKTADTRWNGKFHELKESTDPKEGTIIFLKNGKPQGYYVNKYIAESFQRNPVEGQMIAKILGATGRPFRMAFVELNYGFWLFNAFFRDYQRAVKMLPKNTWFKFLPHYLKGMKPAFKSTFGIPDSVVTEMQKGNMLISVADVHGMRSEDRQIERLLKAYHIVPLKWKSRVVKPFGIFFNWITNVGRALERTTKVGSYDYLKKHFPEMSPEMLAHLVRTRGGSPDFLRKGRGYPIYNNILFFSNAIKEGYRGDYEAFSDSPGEFMWKQAKYTYIPKLLMFAGATGMLGYAIKAMFDGISEYDKTNYLDIPLGITESGKSVYFRVPTDETSRFLGGILWKILNHKKIGWGDVATGLFDYMSGQAPTIHPGIDIAIDVVQYASGRNPYNAFRGRYAIPEQIFEAGGERSHKAFLRYLADKAGANIVYRFKYDDIDRIESELEKVVKFPFTSNIVGRFIKVSDYGIKEDLQRARLEARKNNTRVLLDAKDAIVKLVNGEPLTENDITALAQKPDIIERNLMVALARKHGLIYLDEFLRATTEEEKAAIVRVILEKEQGGRIYEPEPTSSSKNKQEEKRALKAERRKAVNE